MNIVHCVFAGWKQNKECNQREYVETIYREMNNRNLITGINLETSTDGKVLDDNPILESDKGIYCISYYFCTGKYNTKDERRYSINIQFEFDTYSENHYKQLSIDISSVDYEITPENEYLEKVKQFIKDFINRDWKEVWWLYDLDAECLSVTLYPKLFKTENLIRRMIAEAMTKAFGTEWINSLEWTILSKSKEREKHYKIAVPGFNNINDTLLSIDIDDLLSILKTKVGKWSPQYDDRINRMINDQEKWNGDTVKEILAKQNTDITSFWDKVFSVLVDNDYLEQVRKFSMMRNHVAHNKMLDRQAFTSIMENMNAVSIKTKEALDKIARIYVSEEGRQRFQDEFDMISTIQEDLELDFMEEESGVVILDRSEIEDELIEAFESIQEGVKDALMFRQDIEVNVDSIDSIGILGKVDDQKLSFVSNIITNEGQGEDSRLRIRLNNDSTFLCEVVYTNGKAEYNEEQCCYMPIIENSMSNPDDVIQIIVDYIEGAIPNYRLAADSDYYRVIKDCESPVIYEDIQCEECGTYYVSTGEKYAPKGTCLNCGTMNEDIHTCERCGNIFRGTVYSDDPALCESCIADIMDG